MIFFRISVYHKVVKLNRIEALGNIRATLLASERHDYVIIILICYFPIFRRTHIAQNIAETHEKKVWALQRYYDYQNVIVLKTTLIASAAI